MDFSALLNKEISKKKEEAQSVAKESKYLRRGEVERERVRKYEEEQEEARRLREEKLKREREQEDMEREQRSSKRKRGRPDEQQQQQQSLQQQEEADEDLPDLDKQGVKSRLRQLDEPVTIFGETDGMRIRRLLKAERRQQKRLEIERENALLNEEGGLLIEPQKVRDDQSTVNLQIRAYLKYLLARWELVLKERGQETQTEALEVLRQTDDSITLLLNKLRKQTLHEDVFASLATLIIHLQHQEYRQANDTYIKMSIGNAAWPIGVTAVGIHARSAQDKITGKDKVANIMKSEDTRKWLTAVKRLITFAEGHQISI